MKNWHLVIAFGIKSQILLIIAIIALGALAVGVLKPFSLNARMEQWGTLDALVGFITLGIAILVWARQVQQDWEDTLPKRLNIHYLLEGHPVMTCKGASLAGEGDIRQMAMQMGRQINQNQDLALSPRFDLNPPTVENDPQSSQPFKVYDMHMHLSKLPTHIEEIRQRQGPNAIIERTVAGAKFNDEILTPENNGAR